jgi:hypothetical protein
LTYVSDNFTPAAFVSHAANVARKELDAIDLLPRIRHKVLITPEMAPVFRGKEDELAKRFAILTRVLDGQGLQTDSGTHGQRGYRGDYLFAWLGCTTPFEDRVWRVMAQLGSRLFFLLMGSQEELTVEALLESDAPLSYQERLAHCKARVHQFLTALFEAHGGMSNAIRAVPWLRQDDPRPVQTWIARYALLLATMRSEPVKEGDPDRGIFTYTPAMKEQPRRAYAVLRNIARGHALVHGRQQLAPEDLPLVAQVAVSSMPRECGRILMALVQHQALTVAQVQAALAVKHPETARKVMEELAGGGVCEYLPGGPGKTALLRVRPEWAWCSSPEFQAILVG